MAISFTTYTFNCTGESRESYMCRRHHHRRRHPCNSKFSKWWRIYGQTVARRDRLVAETKKEKKYRANTALYFRDYTKLGDPRVARISRVP